MLEQNPVFPLISWAFASAYLSDVVEPGMSMEANQHTTLDAKMRLFLSGIVRLFIAFAEPSALV
jgi:hypothetical protein